MDLKARILEDMKNALRAKDSDRLSAIRLLVAAIKQREIDQRISVDDTETGVVIQKLIKQRREALAQFESAGRADLAAKERFEAELLAAYLPAVVPQAEIDTAIQDAIASLSARTLKDMGRVMALVKQRLPASVDMSAVSAKVRSLLSET